MRRLQWSRHRVALWAAWLVLIAAAGLDRRAASAAVAPGPGDGWSGQDADGALDSSTDGDASDASDAYDSYTDDTYDSYDSYTDDAYDTYDTYDTYDSYTDEDMGSSEDADVDACASIDCDDANPCTDDSCAEGQCFHVPNASPCDDGYVCTEGDACSDGACAGVAKVCDDNVDCTTDTCEEPNGCVFTPDASACPGGDTPCTQPVCDPMMGCMQAAADGACDDSDACTEGDYCIDGVCVPGAPLDCDDGISCTEDSCDSYVGCVHTQTADACTECEDQLSLPPVSGTLGFQFGAMSSCPGFLGGKAGLTVVASGTATKTFPSCPSCSSSFGVNGSLAVNVSACKALGLSVAGGGGYKGTTTYCTECNEDTCKLECGAVSCEKEQFTGFANATVTRFIGYQSSLSTGSVGPIPSIGLTVECGVNVGFKFGATATWGDDKPGECDACPSCETVAGTYSVGGVASGGCFFRLSMFKGNVTLGCADCAQLGLMFGGSGQQRSGDCGSSGCFSLSVTGNAGAKLPCWDVGFWWFQTAVRCAVGAQGTCSGGTCPGGGCKLDNVYASCIVRRGGCQ